MCHGIPRSHPCSHSSVAWSYCPASSIDLKTGYETPCSKTSFGRLQTTDSECPLRNCAFSELGGSWTCCTCRNGPNRQGWCDFAVSKYVQNEDTRCTQAVEVTCGHGCCSNCIPSQSRASDLNSAEAEAADGHKRSSKNQSRSSSHNSGARSHTRTTEGYPSPTFSSSSSSASSSSSSHRWRSSHARDLTPESPVGEEVKAHLYAFREGYGYCGPLDENDEQQQKQLWTEGSSCSLVAPATVLDYSQTASKRRDRR